MRTGERVRIVCLGDSTTAGTPGFLSPIEAPPDGEGDVRSQYAYWMAKSHPEWEVLNRGVNGERTDQILARFQRDVVEEKPKWVIILGGVNDIFQGFPMEFAEHNLAEMYDRTTRVESIPVACTVLPYDIMSPGQARARRELNGWIEAEARKRAIPLVDTSSAVSRKGEPDRLEGTPDGLHPDVEGYRRMAEAISAVLEEHPGRLDPAIVRGLLLVRPPGFEPGRTAWEAAILTRLDQGRATALPRPNSINEPIFCFG